MTGGLRAGWAHRIRGGLDLPGTVVSTDALSDSARRVAEADARRQAPLAPDERLDPNRAPEDELDRLPGVGPGTARSMVAARETLPFRNLEDLVRVRGIGPRTLERLAPHLHVGDAPVDRRGGRTRGPLAGAGRKPAAGSAAVVDVNRASPEELQQLPGVGPVLAARIVQHRSAFGSFRSAEDLLPVPGIGPALLERMRPHLRF